MSKAAVLGVVENCTSVYFGKNVENPDTRNADEKTKRFHRCIQIQRTIQETNYKLCLNLLFICCGIWFVIVKFAFVAKYEIILYIEVKL